MLQLKKKTFYEISQSIGSNTFLKVFSQRSAPERTGKVVGNNSTVSYLATVHQSKKNESPNTKGVTSYLHVVKAEVSRIFYLT